MQRLLMVALMLAVLAQAGCASWRMAEAPSCDGSERRTLNEGMWDGVRASLGACGHQN